MQTRLQPLGQHFWFGAHIPSLKQLFGASEQIPTELFGGHLPLEALAWFGVEQTRPQPFEHLKLI
jgi:hypothetical protein